MRKQYATTALLCVVLIYAGIGLAKCQTTGDSTPPTTNDKPGPSRSIRLNNYNNWFFSSDTTNNRAEMLAILARRDCVTMTEFWDVTPQEITSINPSTKVYRIYDMLVKNDWDTDWGKENFGPNERMQTPLSWKVINDNDWWLRDGNGQIVKESDDTYLLDVGKPGFKEAFLETMLQRMNGQGFVGPVFDYWWPNLRYWVDERGLPRPVDYPTDRDWFEKAWKPFITYITDGMHSSGYRIIGNYVGEYNNSSSEQLFERSKVDGVIYEVWAVGSPYTGDGWISGDVLQKRIQSFYDDPLEVWACDFGLQDVFTAFDQKRVVSLAMYYVAIPASQSMRCYHYYNDSKIFWDPLWDFNIGVPSAPPVKMAGKYFWSRQYKSGLVLLNYESSALIQFPLKSRYVDPSGQVYSKSVVLPPHTGLILAKTR